MATSATALWRAGQPRLYDDALAGGTEAPPAFKADGGRLTLERRLERVWEGLLAVGVAECPVCRSTIERQGAVASCSGCGSTLS